MVDVSYHGFIDDFGDYRIYAVRDGITSRIVHCFKHSPTGLAFGYGGSGPADAARSILADYLQLAPLVSSDRGYCTDAITEIETIYHTFMFDFVVQLSKDCRWTLSGTRIAGWLVGHPPTKTCPIHRESIEDNGCFTCRACVTCNGECSNASGFLCQDCHGSGIRIVS